MWQDHWPGVKGGDLLTTGRGGNSVWKEIEKFQYIKGDNDLILMA